MTRESEELIDWWGELQVEPGQRWTWRIGPSEFWLERTDAAWHLRQRVGDDPLDARLERPRRCDSDEIPSDVDEIRIAQRGEVDTLRLSPLLADRLVVSRPRSPFRVLPGDAATLFVSTPLWIRLELGSGRKLAELGLFRPSDTWFGPSTRIGELGYATRTHCRLDLDDVPARPHRAVTPVRVENRSAELLSLERMGVPAPHLRLYSAAGGLWTDRVDLSWGDQNDEASLEIHPGEILPSLDAVLLTSARESDTGGRLFRAVKAFL